MVDIAESSGAQPVDRFRERGGQKGERALAIKQSWLQVFDVLDINLDHASLSYKPNDNGNKDHPTLQSLNVDSLRNESYVLGKNTDVLTKLTNIAGVLDKKEDLRAKPASVAVEDISSQLAGSDLRADLVSVDIENANVLEKSNDVFAKTTSVAIENINSQLAGSDLRTDLVSIDIASTKNLLERESIQLQQNRCLSSYGLKLIVDRSLIGDQPFGLNDISQLKKPTQIAMVNVATKYRTDVADGESIVKATGKSSNSMVLTIKQDSENVQPSQISLAKADGGYIILARDYRSDENFFTRKLVDTLKSILLAGGVLKKILMNGKTIF